MLGIYGLSILYVTILLALANVSCPALCVMRSQDGMPSRLQPLCSSMAITHVAPQSMCVKSFCTTQLSETSCAHPSRLHLHTLTGLLPLMRCNYHILMTVKTWRGGRDCQRGGTT